MTTAILALLLSLTAWHGDTETERERRARLGVLADAIAEASRGDTTVAVLLVELGRSETHFAQHIHAGRCGEHPLSPRGECDDGRSVSPWQLLHGPWNRKRWHRWRGAGREPTRLAAREAAKLIRAGLRCGHRTGKYDHAAALHGAFAVPARGACRWSGAEARVRRYRALRAQLP